MQTIKNLVLHSIFDREQGKDSINKMILGQSSHKSHQDSFWMLAGWLTLQLQWPILVYEVL